MAGQISYSAQLSAQSSRRTSMSPTTTSASTGAYSISRQQSISSPQELRGMQYDTRRQSTADIMNLDAPARHLYETLERMAQ